MEHRSLCVKHESNKTMLCMEIIQQTMIFFGNRMVKIIYNSWVY